jgi:hypothetical protein
MADFQPKDGNPQQLKLCWLNFNQRMEPTTTKTMMAEFQPKDGNSQQLKL